MVRKPEKRQENKLVVQEVSSHEDIVNRRTTLVPPNRDEASLVDQEESLLPSDQE